MDKRVCHFEIGDLLPIGLTLIVVGIGLSYGLNVISDQKNDLGIDGCAARSDGFTTYNSTSGQCMNSTLSQSAVGTAEFNGSVNSIGGIAKIPEKMPTIATVVIAAVIIGILVRYLMMRYE